MASTTGLDNIMMIKKTGCCHFSQCTFCFWFLNLPPLRKFCYTLRVRLGLLGSLKSQSWDCVLCQLNRKHYWLVWQGMRFLVSLIQRPILLPKTGLLGFHFKLIFVIFQRSMNYANFDFIHSLLWDQSAQPEGTVDAPYSFFSESKFRNWGGSTEFGAAETATS